MDEASADIKLGEVQLQGGTLITVLSSDPHLGYVCVRTPHMNDLAYCGGSHTVQHGDEEAGLKSQT